MHADANRCVVQMLQYASRKNAVQECNTIVVPNHT